jgi:hypothetical protein
VSVVSRPPLKKTPQLGTLRPLAVIGAPTKGACSEQPGNVLKCQDWEFFLDGKMRELPPDESEKADTFVSRFIRLIEIGEKFKWRDRLSWPSWRTSLCAQRRESGQCTVRLYASK